MRCIDNDQSGWLLPGKVAVEAERDLSADPGCRPPFFIGMVCR